jgi:CCGSCS motif protein
MTHLTNIYQVEDNIMFNFFNVEKDQNAQGIEQENLSISDKLQQEENEKETRVHGENGVCCGGCGGQ